MVHLHQAADQNQSKLEAITAPTADWVRWVSSHVAELPPKPAPVGICLLQINYQRLGVIWKCLASKVTALTMRFWSSFVKPSAPVSVIKGFLYPWDQSLTKSPKSSGTKRRFVDRGSHHERLLMICKNKLIFCWRKILKPCSYWCVSQGYTVLAGMCDAKAWRQKEVLS